MTGSLDAIGVIDADSLRERPDAGGLVDARIIVCEGSTARRAPVFVRADAVWPDLRARLDEVFAQARTTYAARHILTLAEPLLVGEGTVIARGHSDSWVLRNSAAEFLAHRRTPVGLEGTGTDDTFRLASPITRRVERRCLLLKRPWANNFGHWLVDQAMALSYVRHVRAIAAPNIVVGKVASQGLREVMMETIAAIMPNAVVLEHPDSEVWAFRKLDYIMPLHVPPVTKLPAALNWLRHDMLAGTDRNVERPRRLHVVRQGVLRVLENEDEVVRIGAARGFQTVQPERLSMREQAALFDQAEAVIGVKGAAMTNIVFANPKCKVMLLSPGSFIDPFFWDIASARGMAYAEVFGQTTTERPSAGHNNFRVNPDDVEAMMEATLAVTS